MVNSVVQIKGKISTWIVWILKWRYLQGFVKYMHYAKGSQDHLWVWRLARRTHTYDLLQNQQNERHIEKSPEEAKQESSLSGVIWDAFNSSSNKSWLQVWNIIYLGKLIRDLVPRDFIEGLTHRHSSLTLNTIPDLKKKLRHSA